MQDVHGQSSLLTNLRGLAQGFGEVISFIADVGGVDSAIVSGHAGQFDEFVCLGVGVREINQSRSQSDGAVLHGLLNQRFHPAEFFGRGRAIYVTHHVEADLSAADIGSNVDRCAVLLEGGEIFSKRAPSTPEAHAGEFFVQLRNGWTEHGAGRLRFSNDFGGHTLADFAFCFAVGQQGEIGVAVKVDESRGNDHALGVDCPLGWHFADASDGRDLSVFDSDGPFVPGTAASVHDVRVNYGEVIWGDGRVLSGRCGGEGGEEQNYNHTTHSTADWHRNQPPTDTEYSSPIVRF